MVTKKYRWTKCIEEETEKFVRKKPKTYIVQSEKHFYNYCNRYAS